MALPFIDSDQLRLAGKLNDVNDAIQGGSSAGGTGAGIYGGLIGKRIWLDNAKALSLSNTAVGTLYAGIYQYVQVLSGATASVARGQVAFVSIGAASATAVKTDDTQYTVTTDGSATVGDGLWAGIFINVITKGNFGWIQIAGLASVKFRAVVTSTIAGNLAIVTTTSNVADAVADATGITGGTTAGLKQSLGVCLEAPVNASISKVFLRNPIFF